MSITPPKCTGKSKHNIVLFCDFFHVDLYDPRTHTSLGDVGLVYDALENNLVAVKREYVLEAENLAFSGGAYVVVVSTPFNVDEPNP